MDEKQLCTLKDARAYLDGLMEEVPNPSPAYDALFEAWGILQIAVTDNEG